MAMDLHDVWRGSADRATAVRAVDAEMLVVGVEEDRLIPIDEQREIHDLFVEAGKKSTWKSLSNQIGTTLSSSSSTS